MSRPTAGAGVMPARSHEPLIPARLHWDGDQPSSRQFGDIYHAPDGAAEVERVFIEPQRLTERLAQTRGVFTVGELGFGTALNFAVIAQRHLAHAPPSARLHFISVEKYPLTLPDFTALARRRGRVLPIYSELARYYPPLIPGWHRRHLAGGRITLSVFFGDASNGLDDIARRQRLPVDAWLLDGFAPDRNPELWNAELWRALAALSADGTTIATFSAVGEVRRGLGDAGFTMRKIDQRPHKRHTLAGTFVSTHRPRNATPGRIVVVGGGLAGACTARQFAQRGVPVTLLDGSEAPPNRMAATLLHCRLLPDGGAPARARRLGYLYAQHWYEQHAEAIDEPLPSGVLQFPGASFDERRIEEAATAYAHTGTLGHPGGRDDRLGAGGAAGAPQRAVLPVRTRTRSRDVVRRAGAPSADRLSPRSDRDRRLNRYGRYGSDKRGTVRRRSRRVMRGRGHQRLRSGAISRIGRRVGTNRTYCAAIDSVDPACRRWLHGSASFGLGHRCNV